MAVCTFDRLRFLPAALASVRCQTVSDFELLVVDDGSRDGTEEWIRGIRADYPGLRYFRSAKNRGAAAARNIAWERARGRFVAWLDSDDVWYPRALETLAGALSRAPALSVATGNFDLIDPAGKVIARKLLSRRLNLNPTFKAAAGIGWSPKHTVTMVRKSHVSGASPFDRGFKRCFEDVDFFLRVAAERGPSAFLFVDEVVAAYRKHDAQLTRLHVPSALGRKAGRDRLWSSEHVYARDMSAVISSLLALEGRTEPADLDILIDLGYLGAKHSNRQGPGRGKRASRASPR